MTELVSLYRKAEQLNIPIYHLPLPQTGSMSVMDEGGRCAIGMDLPSRHTETEQRVRLAHELAAFITAILPATSASSMKTARINTPLRP